MNLSLLCISWSKINYIENNLQEKVVDCLLEIKDTLTDENIQEICKILWSFSNSEFKNENLIEFVYNFVKQEITNFSVNNLIDILLSVGFTYTKNINLIFYLLEVKKILKNLNLFLAYF